MNKYIIEFIGTFFLVFIIALATDDVLAGDAGNSVIAPVVIGFALMVLVYLGKRVSGAHYNPAVTLAILIVKKISPKRAIAYMVFQVGGAAAAALVFYHLLGHWMGALHPQPGFDSGWMPLLVELIFTFILALVILRVAISSRTAGNSYYGLAIGFTIVVAIFAGGPVSGGAFNPAVGTGPIVVHAVLGGGTLTHWWIYLAGPFAGAALAAYVYRLTEKLPEKV